MKLKVISWNIWRGKNLEEVIKFLKDQDADIIGLQEAIEQENGENQAQVIGKSLGYHFIYCKAFTTDRREATQGVGNAILSRFPLEEAECLMLSGMEDYQGSSATEPRGAVKIKLNLNGETLNILCTHLSFNEDNLDSSLIQLKQTDKLLKHLPKEKTVLLGDFNSQPKCEVVKKLTHELINTDPNPTEPSWIYVEGPGKYSNLRIDYIFTTADVKFSNFQVLESDASDHKPLSLEIESSLVISLDEDYIKKVVSLRGFEGEKWLSQIPNLIEEYEEKWNIEVVKQLKSYINFVASAIDAEGQEVILKIYFHNDPEYLAEVGALKAFDGPGVVKLLKESDDKKVILLEKIEPGNPLSGLKDDEEATRIIASVMKKIWQPAPKNSDFPNLKDWSEGFKWYYDNYPTNPPISRKFVEKAERIFQEHLKSPKGEYLLHGDLHHENVLSSDRGGWLIIDPKGVIGEREYEITGMLRNPHTKLAAMDSTQLKSVLNRRLDILVEELGFDRERMLRWGFAQTVLSITWNMQGDRQRWSDWVKVAKVLYTLL